MRYVRDAALRLLRSPGLAVAAVVSIALGTAVATAVTTLVDATLLRPLPFPYSDRLTRAWLDDPMDSRLSLSIPEASDLQATASFDAVWASRAMRGLLYDVGSLDTRAFAAATLALAAVAAAASLIPARRVASVNPVIVMKGD